MFKICYIKRYDYIINYIMDRLKSISTMNPDCSFANHIQTSDACESIRNIRDIPKKKLGDLQEEHELQLALEHSQPKPKPKPKNRFYRSLVQCIVSGLDELYHVIEPKGQALHLSQVIQHMSSSIDEQPTELYEKYGFNKKCMKPSLIQRSFAATLSYPPTSSLSSILYLNEYYQKHFMIRVGDILYRTTPKDYPEYIIHYHNGCYQVDDLDDYSSMIRVTTRDDPLPLLNDIGKGYVYETPLQPISKYKVEDLRKLCKDRDIETTSCGKSKLKPMIYDELYLSYVK